MGFDRKYPNRKDRRKPDYDSRSFDRGCRSHGGCPACQGSRQLREKMADLDMEEQILEMEEENG